MEEEAGFTVKVAMSSDYSVLWESCQTFQAVDVLREAPHQKVLLMKQLHEVVSSCRPVATRKQFLRKPHIRHLPLNKHIHPPMFSVRISHSKQRVIEIENVHHYSAMRHGLRV